MIRRHRLSSDPTGAQRDGPWIRTGSMGRFVRDIQSGVFLLGRRPRNTWYSEY